MEEEQWEYIPGFNKKYAASSFGRIKSFKNNSNGEIMVGNSLKDGRKRVNLNGKKYLVHRLILLTFKPNEQTEENNIVLHLDGNPTNNKLTNLKWGSYKENAQDSQAILRNKLSREKSLKNRIEEQNKVYKDEEWKDIKGYENKYQISNYGRVKSLKRNLIMSLIEQTTGKYYTIGLSKDGLKKHYSVDKLVAEAFLDNPNCYTEVNHLDENGLNNHVNNLEWCSHSQNVQHSIYRQSIKVEQYDLNNNLIASFPSIAEAARNINGVRGNIKRVLNDNDKTAYGYKWKIAKDEF